MSELLWRTHPIYLIHEVSTDGRVRTVDRIVETARGPRRYRGRELKPVPHNGYWTVSVHWGQHVRRVEYIHALVCETFHGPRPSPSHQVRHLNGVPTDNRLENLVWGTPLENADDTRQQGRHNNGRKTHCKRGHPFAGDNLIINRKGNRRCRTCLTQSYRDHYRKNRDTILARMRERSRASRELA